MRKLFELPDETIGIISSLVVNHFLRRCWRYGLSAYHTLDKTTLLLSHPLRPRGHQRFQCPFLPAPYMSITTYSGHPPSSDNEEDFIRRAGRPCFFMCTTRMTDKIWLD